MKDDFRVVLLCNIMWNLFIYFVHFQLSTCHPTLFPSTSASANTGQEYIKKLDSMDLYDYMTRWTHIYICHVEKGLAYVGNNYTKNNFLATRLVQRNALAKVLSLTVTPPSIFSSLARERYSMINKSQIQWPRFLVYVSN